MTTNGKSKHAILQKMQTRETRTQTYGIQKYTHTEAALLKPKIRKHTNRNTATLEIQKETIEHCKHSKHANMKKGQQCITHIHTNIQTTQNCKHATMKNAN